MVTIQKYNISISGKKKRKKSDTMEFWKMRLDIRECRQHSLHVCMQGENKRKLGLHT